MFIQCPYLNSQEVCMCVCVCVCVCEEEVMSVCCVLKGRRGGGAGVTGSVGAAYLGSTSWEDSHTWVIMSVCVCRCAP